MTSSSATQRSSSLGAFALAVLFASGLVLAASWAVDFPGVVLAVAWSVALAAMVTVVVAAYREARNAEVGFFRAVGRSLKDLGRFILDFF